MKEYSEYNVPEFFVEPKHIPTKYYWWSWHVLYPRWAKSCWGGDTIEEALTKFHSPYCDSFNLYQNKLIKESVDGYEEVMDIPCPKTEVWDKCLDNLAKGLYNKPGL